MAQAWHEPRRQLAVDQGAEARCWRASKYEISSEDKLRWTETYVEAASDARWERFSPFDSYRPTTRVRDVEAGPHLAFLKLRSLLFDESELVNTAITVFATKFGLLGVFEEEYFWPPVFAPLKSLIAPEAIIDDQGRLRRVNPATEGIELLSLALAAKGRSSIWNRRMPLETRPTHIALPSEVQFTPKGPFVSNFFAPGVPYRDPVSWEVIKEDFGVLLLLDEESYTGVSVLCTREPIQRWQYSLAYFPSEDDPMEWLLSNSYNAFNWHLRQISPYVLLGEDGTLTRGWHYRSLLQAMYVMLYLDLTGGSTIRKCQSRGCPNYFRIGSQSKSRYCSERCANRASTRMRRGQEP